MTAKNPRELSVTEQNPASSSGVVETVVLLFKEREAAFTRTCSLKVSEAARDGFRRRLVRAQSFVMDRGLKSERIVGVRPGKLGRSVGTMVSEAAWRAAMASGAVRRARGAFRSAGRTAATNSGNRHTSARYFRFLPKPKIAYPERMDPTEFTADAAGELSPIAEAGSSTWAFVPRALPADVPLRNSTVQLLVRAENALGKLQGSVGRMVNPYLIARPLLRREAILSSRMEGTRTTAARLVSVEAYPEGDPDPETHEVANYLEAMNHGVQLLNVIPVSLRLIRALHEKLLDGVRGGQETPGRFRRVQNFIGHADILSARFVPPPADRLDELLDDLERYLNVDDATSETPLLVRIAMAHYQFETIHPFRDGNGRVGRLLVPITLLAQKRISSPVLYLSGYLESRKKKYVDLMLGASQTGQFTAWIEFFLDALRSAADESCETAEQLISLRDRYHAQLHRVRGSALSLKLVDALFELPLTTVARAARILDVTQATAGQHVSRLIEAGILFETTGKKRDRQFIAPELLKALGTDEEASAAED